MALSNIISVGCALVYQFFPSLISRQLVDEMAIIVRDLCGEKTFRGFDDLQRDFLGREEEVIGGELTGRMR